MTKARDLGDFISDGTIAETVTADGLNLGDNETIQLGDNQDLLIWHSGDNSHIRDAGTGNLLIQTNGTAINMQGTSGENYAIFNDNGAVTLNYDNALKFSTSATGATVTGTIAVSDSFNATSGTFTVQSNGTDILNVTSTEMTPQTDGAISLGSASNAFNNMYLDGSAYVSGDVGIGTSSPTQKLHVYGGGVLIDNGSSAGTIYFHDTTNYINLSGDALQFANNGSERMRIDSSGRVAIGDTPKASFTGHSILQVGGQAILGANDTLSATGQTYLSHNLYFDTSGNYQVFNTGSANEGTVYTQADGIHKWSNSAATTGTPSVQERMRIDSSGRLLHGKTTSGDYVTGTEIQPAGAILSYRSGGVAAIHGRTDDGEIIRLTSNSSIVGSIGSNNGNIKVSAFGEEYAALSGTTPTVDCRSGNNFALSTTGSTTFTFSNPPTSGTAFGFTLKVTAGGTHTLTWPTSVDWAGGTAPDAPASGETNVLVFITYDGGTTWYGFQAGAALA